MDRFDGFSVDAYLGRFSGTFDIEETDGKNLRYGDEVIVMVLAKVGRATMDENRLGDMRRTQTLKAETVRFVNPELVSDMLAELGVPQQLALPGTRPSDNPIPDPDGEAISEVSEVMSTPTDVREEEEDGPVVVAAPREMHDDRLRRFLADVS